MKQKQAETEKKERKTEGNHPNAEEIQRNDGIMEGLGWEGRKAQLTPKPSLGRSQALQVRTNWVLLFPWR